MSAMSAAELFARVREFPYILAPLAGYTDSPYRRIARHYGASLLWTEMISEHSLARFDDKIKPLYHYEEDEHPIGLQLFGKAVELFHPAAQKAEALGFDIIDINFGCPARKVTNGGSGSALMKDIKKAESIVKEVVRAVKVPVSIKIRTGWDDAVKNYLEFNKMAEDNGVSMITLHPRTRTLGFRGRADWDRLKDLKEKSKLFVVGSGDVMTASDALRMKEQTGVDAVMIARGSIGNPFIFRQIKDPDFIPSMRERIELCIRHFDAMYLFRGQRACLEIRKFFTKYIKGFDGANEIRKELFALSDRESINLHLAKLLARADELKVIK